MFAGPELAREVEQAERMIQKTPPGVVGNLKTEADRAAYSNKYEDQFVKLINAARKNNGGKTGYLRFSTLIYLFIICSRDTFLLF